LSGWSGPVRDQDGRRAQRFLEHFGPDDYPGGIIWRLDGEFQGEEIKTVLQVTKQAFIRKDESMVDLSNRFVYLAEKPAGRGCWY